MPRTPPPTNTRKKKTDDAKIAGYIRPRVLPGTFVYNEDRNEYKARFSRAYKPAGHDFIRAFAVIYAGYWLKYGLLEYQDVNLYNALCFFAESDMLFTTRGLRQIMNCGDKEIRWRLDRLENAGLIYCLKQEGVHGQPNYYVIRTPLFESPKALTPRVKKRIADAGDELPKHFLAGEAARLGQQIKENQAKQRRDDPAAHPEGEERRRYWNNALKSFKGDIQAAVDFDNIVADIITEARGQRQPLDVFEKILRHECNRNQIELTPRLIDLAHSIRAFYDTFQRSAPAYSTRVIEDKGLMDEETIKRMLRGEQ